jgi:hypothetical protein
VADYETKVMTGVGSSMDQITKMVQDMQNEFARQNILAEAGAKVKEANDKAEKAKEQAAQAPQQARQSDIGQLGEMAKSMTETHKQSIEALNTIKDTLAASAKPKKLKIKTGNKTYEVESS